MQETTLFVQNGNKEVISESPEELESSHVQSNGGATVSKRPSAKGLSPESNNGHLNTSYKDELSSDEDNT